MPGPIRAVIFDLDDTLYDCTGTLLDASRRRAARVLVDAGLPMSEREALELQRALGEEHGPHFLVFDEIARRYDLEEEVINQAYRAYNSDEVDHIEPFSDVKPTLRFLRNQGIACALLTSGVHRRQAVKIEKLGLADEFDQIIINDVERGELMGECMRYVLEKHRLRPEEALVVGDRPPEEIHAGKDLGMLTAQMLHGRFSAFEARDDSERPHYRITRISQVPTLVRLLNMNKTPESLRIVAIGGGTGLPIVLEGCKTYCRAPTGIVTVTDSGRSSGRLRDELGILPPGDARNCLVALSEPGESERMLNRLFQYRFQQGSFEGMSLGNLVIAAMTDLEDSFREGIGSLSRLLNIRGKVLPPTTTDCHICAELEDGTHRQGEVNVRGLNKPPIRRLYLEPEDPPACEEAVQEIMDADIVLIGPGSLYTSVIANVLVPGIRQALAETNATTVYVVNIVTQPGQTDGYGAADHVRAVLQHAGEDAVDYALINVQFPGDGMLERYRSEGADTVAPEPALHELGVEVVEASLVEDLDQKRVLWEKQDLLRHHPDKLADAVCRIYAGLPPSMNGADPA
ncbi:MAG: uridine diphosphate-N-acetylglucosamine-binding protein YvcK [Candidatus Brocadiia bacterium]